MSGSVKELLQQTVSRIEALEKEAQEDIARYDNNCSWLKAARRKRLDKETFYLRVHRDRLFHELAVAEQFKSPVKEA